MKLDRLWTGVASLAGAGYAPGMPGTIGSLVVLPLAWALSYLSIWWYGTIVVGLIPVSVYIAGRAGRAWGAADHQRIVIDEMVGMLIACMGLSPSSWRWFGIAFLAFRLFDITKPWPASYFDREESGFGVVMDDVCAGLYALIVVQLLKWIFQ